METGSQSHVSDLENAVSSSYSSYTFNKRKTPYLCNIKYEFLNKNYNRIDELSSSKKGTCNISFGQKNHVPTIDIFDCDGAQDPYNFTKNMILEYVPAKELHKSNKKSGIIITFKGGTLLHLYDTRSLAQIEAKLLDLQNQFEQYTHSQKI